MNEPPDLLPRLRAWSYRRQRLDRSATGSLEALHAVIAVYSSHPTAPLALLSRTQSLQATDFSALEQRRDAIRIPAMRQSIFLVPANTAPRLFAALPFSPAHKARNLSYAGLDADAYERLKPRVLEQVQTPITSAALQKAIAVDARLMTAVRLMSYEGLILRLGAGLRGDSLRYVATEAWLGHPIEAADATESVAWLAEAYLRAYGPARVEDFAWWSGIPKRQAAAAIAKGSTVDVGAGLLLPADQQRAFERVEPLEPETIALLPKWDAYTMGHAPDGRQRLVAEEHRRYAYSSVRSGAGVTAGDGLPLILQGGRAVASWSHRFEGNRMLVLVAPFPGEILPSALWDQSFNDAGHLLGANAIAIAALGPPESE